MVFTGTESEYKGRVIPFRRSAVPNVKNTPLSFDDLNRVIAYDPLTGAFTWRVNAAKNIKAGDPAGCVKALRKSGGLDRSYSYIKYNGYEITAARVAWLLHHGEWPNGNVQFDDGDSLNLKADNLRLAHFPTHVVVTGGKKRNVMTRSAAHHYGLMRHYGITLQEYSVMLLAQNGVCAICDRPETVVVHGAVKPLSVDHDHATGAIRDLLCNACNHLLGHAEEKIEVLEKAAAYLRRHKDLAIRAA